MISKPNIPLSLPVIDFSSRDLIPGTPEWDSVRARVRKALVEYGSFEALFDGVSMEQRNYLFKASEEIFDLSLETKLGTKTKELIYDGYMTIPTMPLYESMGFYGVENPKVVQNLTLKIWPQGNNTFSENVLSYVDKVTELNVKLSTMIMESFGLEKYIKEHLNSTRKHIQLIKYNKLDANKDQNVGFDEHIDRQFITILCQNDVVDGLEIQTKDGENWIKVKPSQDSSFVVMAGACLHLLMNGEVLPPLHRVVITGKKERYVVGVFYPPKEGFLVNAPEELIDEEHPRLYKPFSFDAYVKLTGKNTKNRGLPGLKEYCAI
ncbi:unnamed protein product [Cochlearia groenlandica]